MDIAKAVDQLYTIARALEKLDGALADDIRTCAERLNNQEGVLISDKDLEDIKRAT